MTPEEIIPAIKNPYADKILRKWIEVQTALEE